MENKNTKLTKLILFSLLFVFIFNFVNATSVTSDEVPVDFSVSGSGTLTCNNTNPLDVFWSNYSGDYNIQIFNSTYNQGCNGNPSWCCPNGRTCLNNQCIINTTVPLEDCSQLRTLGECNGAGREFVPQIFEANCSAFQNINVGGKNCALYPVCGCVWDDSKRPKCGFKIENYTQCPGEGSTRSSLCNYFQESIEDKCDSSEGKITITYHDADHSNCVDKVISSPCSVSVKLPFFDKFSFIFSVLGISLIYFLMRRKL